MDTTNLTKLDDEHWEIYFSYSTDLEEGRDWVRRRFHGTRKEAAEKRDILKSKAKSGELNGRRTRSPDDPTVRHFWPDYQDARQNDPKWEVAPSTWNKARSKLENHVLPKIGNWKVEEIEIPDLDWLNREWRDLTTEKGGDYSPATVNGWIRAGRTLLKFCLYQLSEPRKWVEEWETLSEENVEPAGRALSAEESEKFFKKLRELYPQWYPLAFTLRATGQRFGTVAALEWRDINFGEETIQFRRSHWEGDVSRGTKTGQVLTLPLTENLRFQLLNHADRIGRKDHEGAEETSLVFPADVDPEESPRNGYLCPSSIARPLKRAGKKAGIGPVSVHDLRRTFVTSALERGIHPERIKQVTGQCDRMIRAYFRSTSTGDSAVMQAGGMYQSEDDSDTSVLAAADPPV